MGDILWVSCVYRNGKLQINCLHFIRVHNYLNKILLLINNLH